MTPARPEASTRYLKVVVPVSLIGSERISGLSVSSLGPFGDAGGEMGAGGGVCVHEADIGLEGSV